MRSKLGTPGADPFFDTRRDELVALAARHMVPTIYHFREFAAAGGLAVAIDDAPRPQTGERLNDQREALGQVIARAAVESNAAAVLAGDDGGL